MKVLISFFVRLFVVVLFVFSSYSVFSNDEARLENTPIKKSEQILQSNASSKLFEEPSSRLELAARCLNEDEICKEKGKRLGYCCSGLVCEDAGSYGSICGKP